jgi:hypothetical protein
LRFWKIKKVISIWRKRENLSKEFAQSEKKYSWRKQVNNIEKKKLLQAYPEVIISRSLESTGTIGEKVSYNIFVFFY